MKHILKDDNCVVLSSEVPTGHSSGIEVDTFYVADVIPPYSSKLTKNAVLGCTHALQGEGGVVISGLGDYCLHIPTLHFCTEITLFRILSGYPAAENIHAIEQSYVEEVAM